MTFTHFWVLPGRLLVHPDLDEVRSAGGIWFSDNMHRKAQTGYVLQHTQRSLEENLAGKHILFEKYVWKTLEFQGITFYIIEEPSVFAVLEADASAERERGDVAQGVSTQKEYTHGNS